MKSPLRPLLPLVLLAVFHICAGCLALRQAAPPAGRSAAIAISPPAFRTMTLGLCEDYPKSSRTLAYARHDLQVCHASGAKVLRIAFSWLDMEPARGQFDFSFWDQFIDMAANEYHIRLIPYVCYTPRWAATDSSDQYWHSAPRDSTDFARFVTALVTRYHDRIHSWELWNEPDNPSYWSGSMAQFAALVKAGSQAVRSADPSAAVVLGGIAWRTDFVADLLADPAILPAIDIINMHAYDETWSADALEQLPVSIHRMHELIAQHGGHQHLWLAEVGYSDFRRPDGYISDQYTARRPFEHTPDYQADMLLRTAALAASTGEVDLLAWYRINDLPEDIGVIGDANNRHLGLLDAHGNPKPALASFHRAAQFFGQPRAPVDDWIDPPVTASGLQLHAFADPAGNISLFAWRPTFFPATEGLRAAAPSATPATCSIALCISAAAAKRCRPDAANCVNLTVAPGHLQLQTFPRQVSFTPSGAHALFPPPSATVLLQAQP